MKEISKHPILPIPESERVIFHFDGKEIEGQKGLSIAAALHRAGYPVHSHSLQNRNRSLECGIGKCGACEMLVDGQIKRICITPCDNVLEVRELNDQDHSILQPNNSNKETKIYRTQVLIIGAGPAGLATRKVLQEHNIQVLVVDANEGPGGQFLMQTHAFFFFEKERKFGGRRGFEIAKDLAGENPKDIFFNTTVWDILDKQRVALKNLLTHEIFYIEAKHLVVAAGAVPFMPAFANDDLPGVYTAAVIQKMMNREFTLLGKNVLTVGAGNIGYLTSYQLEQAGANVKAIIEAQPNEGGFPVQANRVRRLGIPVMTSHILLQAIPNNDGTGIEGAILARCQNFKPIPGTEFILKGIDVINICTGLVPDDSLLIKGREIFGRHCYGAGDALRIGEGTSAVLRGKQVAYEILEELHAPYHYNQFLEISKEYIDSQQHPVKILEQPKLPTTDRQVAKPFVVTDCLYGFACNPCVHACPHGAISKSSTSTVPQVDYDKCIGCMECVHQCPGLAIFGFQPSDNKIFIPYEFLIPENEKEVILVDNFGQNIGNGLIEKVLTKASKTNIVRIKVESLQTQNLTDVRGFHFASQCRDALSCKSTSYLASDDAFICHCDDVRLTDVLDIVGDRKFISVEEIKHTTRLGMGACRGKRCIPRLKQTLAAQGISLIGAPTPRGPLSNQVTIGELYPSNQPVKILPHPLAKVEKRKVRSFVAGGGMAGSSVFRYLAEAGLQPVLINSGFGSSWRNIAGGRPAFSVPELSDIARHNMELFKEIQKIRNIDFRVTRYINFAHDDKSLQDLERSMKWQDAYMIDPKDFSKEVAPGFNSNLKTYKAALISKDCWQATPGKVVDYLRHVGISKGGKVYEDAKIVDLHRVNSTYFLLVQMHDNSYIEFETEHFVNALGPQGGEMALKAGYDTGIYPVKHQAFITRRLPMLGINGNPLDMLIDRRSYKGFVAVYGQQLAETGQIIGCASPLVEPLETAKNLKINSREFIEIVSEVFTDWIPELSGAGFQAVWAGYYAEPRMIIDPDCGLFLGLRGQGFMLSQYLGKIYVDKLTGKPVPEYMDRLRFESEGLLEKAFK
jgi:glycine/D-amino acid oxidase-like deaminating enzyme/Fe-S-cluster-containing hydrogenase component 2